MVSPRSHTCGCGRRVVGACNLWMVQTFGRKVQSYWLRQVGNSFAWIVPGPADKTQSLSPQDTKCSGPSSTHYISTCWALKPSGNETMYVLKIQHVVKYVSGLEPTCLALWRTESLFTSGGLCIFLAYEFPHWPGPLFNGQPSTWSGLKTSGACFV